MRAPRQRGAAILTAMLLVTLVAALSAAALWQQWRTLEVESAERQRIQASWLLQGAADWARLILREDTRTGTTDHLAEPWAVPLQEAKLSAFLASEGDGALDALQAASLSGQIVDLQGRLNLLNLVQEGRAEPATLQTATRLFEALHLPPVELQRLVSQLQLALEPPDSAGFARQPHPLLPRSAEQLHWLGLSAPSVRALQPYVVLLPERTPLNLNTAAPALLQASLGVDAAAAQRLVAARTLNPFRSLADVVQAAGVAKLVTLDAQHSVNSRYFEVRARLRLGTLDTTERTVVQREGLLVKPLWKERVAGEMAFVQ
nr:type II secretion system minor pseudopilin GspK [uncultured Rhodoferax sp.]